MLTLALSAAGTPGTQAELNDDGGAWVTNSSGSEYSRSVKAIRQKDSPGSVDSSGSGALGASWRLTDGRAGVTFRVTLIIGPARTGLLIGGLVGESLTQAAFGSPAVGLAVLALLTVFAATCVAVLVGSLLNQFVAADSVGTDPLGTP